MLLVAGSGGVAGLKNTVLAPMPAIGRKNALFWPSTVSRITVLFRPSTVCMKSVCERARCSRRGGNILPVARRSRSCLWTLSVCSLSLPALYVVYAGAKKSHALFCLVWPTRPSCRCCGLIAETLATAAWTTRAWFTTCRAR